MKFTTLISTDGLAQNLKQPDWVVIDCRFRLDDTEKGRRDYAKSHIPGAYYAHVDEDLSGEIIPGVTGRHPLPDVDEFVARLGSWGISNKTQVIAYDDKGGMSAARVWWLLRWLGHEAVAVLNGGYPAWLESSHPVASDVPVSKDQLFIPAPHDEMWVSAEDILGIFGDPGFLLIDSRAPDRFRGENEIIDPVAGRIPGAINHFWEDNLEANGHFHIKDVLRGRFQVLFKDIPLQNVVFYCGSGVSAAHNLLAVAHAGIGIPRLYAGSWSHWITDPERPIVTG